MSAQLATQSTDVLETKQSVLYRVIVQASGWITVYGYEVGHIYRNNLPFRSSGWANLVGLHACP
jgi:hypothetical protein